MGPATIRMAIRQPVAKLGCGRSCGEQPHASPLRQRNAELSHWRQHPRSLALQLVLNTPLATASPHPKDCGVYSSIASARAG
ncbi:hypothetical protein CBM2634_A240089 [Cupriavidus taiwanensis]|uniref:Uncharacterized protein n=1 Tax=Cupriavidus taiwanensis TaxID=164546 RepID=A0A375IZC9_9BURK|nr:hypothetical protein CBM2634_A240089 [Cupriavidus taiwanensis]